MALVRVAVAERTRALVHGLHDLVADEDPRYGHVPATQTLADGLEVGHDILLLPGVQGAAAAHAGHDLVEDEQRTVFLADGLHGLEVSFHCGDGAESLCNEVEVLVSASRANYRTGEDTYSTDDGLCDEGTNGVGSDPLELGVQFVGEPLDVVRL